MTDADWADAGAKSVALVLSVDAELDDDGEPMLDDDLAVLVNAWWEPLDFAVPWTGDDHWTIASDSYQPVNRGSRFPVRQSPSDPGRWSWLSAPPDSTHKDPGPGDQPRPALPGWPSKEVRQAQEHSRLPLPEVQPAGAVSAGPLIRARNTQYVQP